MQKLLTKIPKIKIAPKFYLKLPENPGVYIYFNEKTPIYVGKAINLKNRVSSYFRLKLDTKTKTMIGEADSISCIKVDSELEALLLEAKLIKTFLPKYNIISKDDKHPLYIIITKETYPRILAVRKPDLSSYVKCQIFGPFPSSTNVRFVLKMLRKIFPYSDHKIGKRACLYSQIGLCNPCPNVIEVSSQKKILKNIYAKNIRHIKTLLEGNIRSVKNRLENDMLLLSKNDNFEEAAEIRDKIRKLEYITQPNTPINSYLENPNLFEDQRKKELDDLCGILRKNKLDFDRLTRIECFDIAHLGGTSVTASMVTFVDGVPEKKLYRHFKIYQTKGNDDYKSMNEVAERRKKHLEDWGRPDLIIVDGGKGQLAVFLKVFQKENIPIIGLAKRFETLVIPTTYLGANSLIEYRLQKGGALYLVSRIRDEAHRFARTYHHKLTSKALIENFS